MVVIWGIGTLKNNSFIFCVLMFELISECFTSKGDNCDDDEKQAG